jgi:hypothetical protein
MLRITGSAILSEQFVLPSENELGHLREEFGRRHRVVLPGLLAPRLAGEIARRVAEAEFYRREHEGIGVEECMDVNSTLAWLLLLVNDERMVETVRSISGCEPIGHFDGRVYRLDPSAADHHDSWHDDLGEARLVAMSVNLGQRPFDGGALEIRDRRTRATATARNAELGDGLLFELGEHLEHRVLPVTGAAPRTVFAGWFKAGPSFLSVLRSDGAPIAAASGTDPTAII